MFDWNDLSDKDGNNDMSIAYAPGYVFRVAKKIGQEGYNCYALSIYGEEFIGYGKEKSGAQSQAEKWFSNKARGL
jgi:hypothetical protein